MRDKQSIYVPYTHFLSLNKNKDIIKAALKVL
jgi:hypothetical protein